MYRESVREIVLLETEVFDTFHATGLFLYSLHMSENQGFSDVFRSYKKRPVACNGLTKYNCFETILQIPMKTAF